MKKSKLMTKNFKIFSSPISLRVTLKLCLRSCFSAKKYFFVFCRKFGFNLEKLSNHYLQLEKQVKVDPETRSYDFLTKTHQKIPTIPDMVILWTTLVNGMIMTKFRIDVFSKTHKPNIEDFFQINLFI